MAFRGSSLEEQRKARVNALISEGILKTDRVIQAMLAVPREKFLPERLHEFSYVDSPLPICQGQTISAPHMVAIMNEALELEPGNIVLEIGAGSGYHAATIAEIVAPRRGERQGHVYTVEIIEELADFARRNLENADYGNKVTVIHADGSEGYPRRAPYERILVTAGAPQIPQPLIEQLKPGGILIIPVGGLYMFQSLKIARKDEQGKLTVEDRGGCAFVLLRGKYGWKT